MRMMSILINGEAHGNERSSNMHAMATESRPNRAGMLVC
jgi:hypothetical protein